jgi:hypothetical protein
VSSDTTVPAASTTTGMSRCCAAITLTVCAPARAADAAAAGSATACAVSARGIQR